MKCIQSKICLENQPFRERKTIPGFVLQLWSRHRHRNWPGPSSEPVCNWSVKIDHLPRRRASCCAEWRPFCSLTAGKTHNNADSTHIMLHNINLPGGGNSRGHMLSFPQLESVCLAWPGDHNCCSPERNGHSSHCEWECTCATKEQESFKIFLDNTSNLRLFVFFFLKNFSPRKNGRQSAGKLAGACLGLLKEQCSVVHFL